MGGIVFWTIIRTVILIPAIWIMQGFMDYQLWWTSSILLIYGVILHPAIVQYRLFLEKNDRVMNDSMCATCKHFDKSAVICLKYDEHPTMKYLPCEGMDWEPISQLKSENEEY